MLEDLLEELAQCCYWKIENSHQESWRDFTVLDEIGGHVEWQSPFPENQSSAQAEPNAFLASANANYAKRLP
jgi:hypothetical protein